MQIKFILIFVAIIVQSCGAQYSTRNAHSHNDYEQKRPFNLAFENHFGSIEADIWEVDGELFVAHNRNQIKPERSFDAMYILPIVEKFRLNGGEAWNDYPGTFQLLIDLKTACEPTLSLLVQKINKYPEVFNPEVNENAVRVVITGNRPEPDKFELYPGFVFFDGELSRIYTEKQRKRILLFSDNFKKHSQWNGEENIPVNEQEKLSHLVDSVHSLDLKIRFWNAPDNTKTWETFIGMQIDFINTDHIQELADYLNRK